MKGFPDGLGICTFRESTPKHQAPGREVPHTPRFLRKDLVMRSLEAVTGARGGLSEQVTRSSSQVLRVHNGY